MRRTAKYCSDRCRVQAQRSPDVPVAPVTALPQPPQPAGGPLESAARAELEAVGRADALAGAVVLALARRIDSAGADDTGSAFAALTKELRAALASAVAGAEQAADPIDELRAHAERKRNAR